MGIGEEKTKNETCLMIVGKHTDKQWIALVVVAAARIPNAMIVAVGRLSFVDGEESRIEEEVVGSLQSVVKVAWHVLMSIVPLSRLALQSGHSAP